MKKVLLPLLVTTLVACGGDDEDGVDIESSGGVDFPEEWRDLSAIGATYRRDAGNVVLILGNDTAANSAKQIAAGQATTWDEGSQIVRVVWSEEVNTFSTDTLAPGNFASLTVMEKNTDDFSDTLGWGYGLWRGDDLAPADTSQPIVNDEPCVDCHVREVGASKDFVFTNPLQMPSDAAFANAGISSGISMPDNVANWKFIGVHHRETATQVRVIVGNDIAVDAARSGEVNPWPEGSQIADFVFAGADNADWADRMYGAEGFGALAFMERDSDQYPPENGGWGYAFWAGADLTARDAAVEPIVADQTCATCHNRNVGINDYVFTRPGPLPSGDL